MESAVCMNGILDNRNNYFILYTLIMDFRTYFIDSAALLHTFIDQEEETLHTIASVIIQTLEQSGCVFHIWNGGSAADAQHFDAELVGTFYNKQRKGLRSEALTTNSSTLTAVGNDLWFDEIFARQLEWKAKVWDMLVAFSTSGNSKNCLRALEKARELWVVTVWLLWNTWWAMQSLCDYALVVPSTDTPKIQQIHETIFHALCIQIDHHFS